jgi:hypothetical protein
MKPMVCALGTLVLISLPAFAQGGNGGSSAVPTNIDPCALVTKVEASRLGGVAYGDGTESTTERNGRICAYSSTSAVIQVVVAVAASKEIAKQEESEAIAEAEQEAAQVNANLHLKNSPLPGFAPGVDAWRLSAGGPFFGHTLNVTGFYLLKGTTFVGFSELALDKPAANDADMQAQATTIVGRLAVPRRLVERISRSTFFDATTHATTSQWDAHRPLP